jgi:hypothetical protein
VHPDLATVDDLDDDRGASRIRDLPVERQGRTTEARVVNIDDEFLGSCRLSGLIRPFTLDFGDSDHAIKGIVSRRFFTSPSMPLTSEIILECISEPSCVQGGTACFPDSTWKPTFGESPKAIFDPMSLSHHFTVRHLPTILYSTFEPVMSGVFAMIITSRIHFAFIDG